MEEIQSYFPETIAEEETLSAGDDFGAEDSEDSGAHFKKSPSYLQRFFQRCALSVILASSGCAFAFRQKKPEQYKKIEETTQPMEMKTRSSTTKIETSINGKILAISAYQENENVHMATPVKITKISSDDGLNPVWIGIDWLVSGLAIYGGVNAVTYALNRSDEQREFDCRDKNPDPAKEHTSMSCYAGGFGVGLILAGTTWAVSSILSTKEYLSEDKLVDKKVTLGEPFEDRVSTASIPLKNMPITLVTPQRTIELGTTDSLGQLSVILPGLLDCSDFRDIKPGEQFKLSFRGKDKTTEVTIDADRLAEGTAIDDEDREYKEIMRALSDNTDQIAPALRFLNLFPHGCMAANVRDFVEKRKKQMFQGVVEVMEDGTILPKEICKGNPDLKRGERVMLHRKPNHWDITTLDGRCSGMTERPFQMRFREYFDPLGTEIERLESEISRNFLAFRSLDEIFLPRVISSLKIQPHSLPDSEISVCGATDKCITDKNIPIPIPSHLRTVVQAISIRVNNVQTSVKKESKNGTPCLPQYRTTQAASINISIMYRKGHSHLGKCHPGKIQDILSSIFKPEFLRENFIDLEIQYAGKVYTDVAALSHRPVHCEFASSRRSHITTYFYDCGYQANFANQAENLRMRCNEIPPSQEEDTYRINIEISGNGRLHPICPTSFSGADNADGLRKHKKFIELLGETARIFRLDKKMSERNLKEAEKMQREKISVPRRIAIHAERSLFQGLEKGKTYYSLPDRNIRRALLLFQQAFELSITLQFELDEQLWIATRLGELYFLRRNYKNAIEMAQRALEIYEKMGQFSIYELEYNGAYLDLAKRAKKILELDQQSTQQAEAFVGALTGLIEIAERKERFKKGTQTIEDECHAMGLDESGCARFKIGRAYRARVEQRARAAGVSPEEWERQNYEREKQKERLEESKRESEEIERRLKTDQRQKNCNANCKRQYEWCDGCRAQGRGQNAGYQFIMCGQKDANRPCEQERNKCEDRCR